MHMISCENEDSFLKWSSGSFQVLAAKFINEFNPYTYLVVCTLGLLSDDPTLTHCLLLDK